VVRGELRIILPASPLLSLAATVIAFSGCDLGLRAEPPALAVQSRYAKCCDACDACDACGAAGGGDCGFDWNSWCELWVNLIGSAWDQGSSRSWLGDGYHEPRTRHCARSAGKPGNRRLFRLGDGCCGAWLRCCGAACCEALLRRRFGCRPQPYKRKTPDTARRPFPGLQILRLRVAQWMLATSRRSLMAWPTAA
jgi:hypothetical protein